ncbi:hypothetical protein MMC07_009836, partial [Pseudocyphellaria aurata]|nr:hypothetical protein [Pseudocyphellaria aurata]
MESFGDKAIIAWNGRLSGSSRKWIIQLPGLALVQTPTQISFKRRQAHTLAELSLPTNPRFSIPQLVTSGTQASTVTNQDANIDTYVRHAA